MQKADAVVGRTVSIHLHISGMAEFTAGGIKLMKEYISMNIHKSFFFFLKQITLKKKIQFDQSINIFF